MKENLHTMTIASSVKTYTMWKHHGLRFACRRCGPDTNVRRHCPDGLNVLTSGRMCATSSLIMFGLTECVDAVETIIMWFTQQTSSFLDWLYGLTSGENHAMIVSRLIKYTDHQASGDHRAWCSDRLDGFRWTDLHTHVVSSRSCIFSGPVEWTDPQTTLHNTNLDWVNRPDLQTHVVIGHRDTLCWTWREERRRWRPCLPDKTEYIVKVTGNESGKGYQVS